MKRTAENPTLQFYPAMKPQLRLFALWYFGCLITIWIILGHTVLGFEQSWAQPAVAVLTTCTVHWLLEWVDSTSKNREPRYRGGLMAKVNFFIPAWIPGVAVGMLIYPTNLLWPFAFAGGLAIASKLIFRAPVANNTTQHVFNPSNFGISCTLLLMPWVGLAPPYQFTENITGIWDWVLPGIVLFSGIIVHALFTGRLPLVMAWIGGFVLQALLRSWYFDIPWQVPLIPMTSAAFILFTLYMIPDPATTPINRHRQIMFGLAVATVYAILQITHIVFGLFLALILVCGARGVGLYMLSWSRKTANNPLTQPLKASASEQQG